MNKKHLGKVALATLIGLSAVVYGPALHAATGSTELISRSTGGTQANQESRQAEISADGRYVAFTSEATNLVTNTNSTRHVYVRDRQSGVTENIDTDGAGSQGDGSADSPSISADGRYVAFVSNANNLSAGNLNPSHTMAVWLRDRVAGTTQLVSRTPGGTMPNNLSWQPKVSADGNTVAYNSQASNIVSDDTNNTGDVFAYDRPADTTTRVSLTSNGEQYGAFSGDTLAVSADGRYVCYNSYAGLAVPGFGAGLFLKDRTTGTLEGVSRGSEDQGLGLDGASGCGISADGRYVSFNSPLDSVVPGDTNSATDLFIRDRSLGTTERASLTSSGDEANGNSAGFISPSAQTVLFYSTATNLDPADTNNTADLYLRDRTSGTVELMSIGAAGAQANGESAQGTISADDRYIAFQSYASNIISPDANGTTPDIFLRDRQGAPLDTTAPVVMGTPDRPANSAGWYKANVVIDWQATDPEPSSGAPTQPANTTASTEGANIVYTSTPSCDPAGNCATGSLTLSIDKTTPTVGAPVFSTNPKATNQTTTLTAPAGDNLSGVTRGEYYLGTTDPGTGNGTAMTLSGSNLTATIGTGQTPGTYPVSVRSLDRAGNWSSVATGSLVVYEPAASPTTGNGSFRPTTAAGDYLPGLNAANPGYYNATFDLSARYINGSLASPSNDFSMRYRTGGLLCVVGIGNCSDFQLDSLSMNWYTLTAGGSLATIQGTASVKVNGITTLNPYRVEALDGDAASPRRADHILVKVYAPTANPNTATPIYQASGNVQLLGYIRTR